MSIDDTMRFEAWRRTYCLLGLPFDAVSMADVQDRIHDAAKTRRRLVIATANINFLMTARADPAFRQSVIASQLCVADGMPVVWLARLLGIPLSERVAGAGLFSELIEQQRPLRVFLFGAGHGVAASACERINARAGGVRCVGFESPGYVSIDAMSQEATLDRIDRATPDFLVLSLGAQKGHAWIDRNQAVLRVPVISHLGAVVNFEASTLQRAPRWLQQLGLEWLWRIKEEPQLWRRYGRDGLRLASLFIRCVVPLLWRRRRQHRAPVGKMLGIPSGSTLFIQAVGSIRGDELGPLRELLASTADFDRIEVSFQGAQWLDAEVMGLLVQLYAWQLRRGGSFKVKDPSPDMERLFGWYGLEYLLEDQHSRQFIGRSQVPQSRV